MHQTKLCKECKMHSIKRRNSRTDLIIRNTRKIRVSFRIRKVRKWESFGRRLPPPTAGLVVDSIMRSNSENTTRHVSKIFHLPSSPWANNVGCTKNFTRTSIVYQRVKIDSITKPEVPSVNNSTSEPAKAFSILRSVEILIRTVFATMIVKDSALNQELSTMRAKRLCLSGLSKPFHHVKRACIRCSAIPKICPTDIHAHE
mmetsp:Transcript_111260/g.173936  ORF Transcript_111260/g.173936 Transcript_111260/m.173936 type:complete len:201 (+) Transcript_111260:1019-1621(+)